MSSKHCQSSLRIHSAIASWIHSYFDIVMTKFMINNRTDAWKTDVNLLNNTLQARENMSHVLRAGKHATGKSAGKHATGKKPRRGGGRWRGKGGGVALVMHQSHHEYGYQRSPFLHSVAVSISYHICSTTTPVHHHCGDFLLDQLTHGAYGVRSTFQNQ